MVNLKCLFGVHKPERKVAITLPGGHKICYEIICSECGKVVLDLHRDR